MEEQFGLRFLTMLWQENIGYKLRLPENQNRYSITSEN